jgi:hypothetical protein
MSASVTQVAAAPGFGTGNAVTVPSDVMVRFVYGSAGDWGVLGFPEFQAFVETGIGTGAYDKVQVVAGGINSMRVPFCFLVQGGRRYYFERQDSTLTFRGYSFTDLR